MKLFDWAFKRKPKAKPVSPVRETRGTPTMVRPSLSPSYPRRVSMQSFAASPALAPSSGLDVADVLILHSLMSSGNSHSAESSSCAAESTPSYSSGGSGDFGGGGASSGWSSDSSSSDSSSSSSDSGSSSSSD